MVIVKDEPIEQWLQGVGGVMLFGFGELIVFEVPFDEVAIISAA